MSEIKEAGLDAMVMAMFYVSQSYIDAHTDRFIWKGVIDPSNPRLFFENYTRLLEKMIPLLNEYNVKSLVVLDETGNLNTSYPEFISGMLTTLSSEFNGKLGIDISGNNILEGVYWDNKKRTWKGTIGQMTFFGWKSPDGEELEALSSCGTPSIETQKDQRVSVMIVNFVKFWKPLFNYVASTYSNQLQFGELEVYNADGQSLGASYWQLTNKVFDEQERADAWYAYLKGAEELTIKSLNIWTIPLGDLWPNDVAGDFFINTGLRSPESQAYRIIKAIIGPDS